MRGTIHGPALEVSQVRGKSSKRYDLATIKRCLKVLRVGAMVGAMVRVIKGESSD